jgi:imidazolonepropionase-like amidohydrolase
MVTGIVAALTVMLGPLAFGQGVNAAGGSLSKRYEFVNGRWFDGREFQEVTFYAVDGRLTRTRPAVVDEKVDLRGGFVIPPFGEAHNHNVEGPWNLEETVARYLHDGVFYVKNPNSIREFTSQISGQINKPWSIDVVFANAGLTSSGGHPIPLYEQVLRESRYKAVIGEVPAGWFKNRGYVVIDSEADLQRQWTEIVAGKPEFLKVYLVHSEDARRVSHADGAAGRKGLDPALVPAIVERAHREKLRVTAHVETAADFRLAVSAGVDEIAHVPGWFLGTTAEAPQLLLTDEDARLASRAGVVVVTTTAAMKPHAGGHGHQEPAHGSYGGQSHSFTMEASLWPKAQEIQTKNLQLLHQHGVRLAIGSDHAATSLAEALHMHELGIFNNLTLLKLWCEQTPQAIFPDRRIGRLQEGDEASFLVLKENPIEKFEAVTELTFRMKQGYVLHGKP